MNTSSKLSPSKKQKSPQRKHSPSRYQPHNQKLHSKNYFCHYSNAIYMGGIDCFKKNGQGIMLMDNGVCTLTCHSHDNMINHNVFFRDRSMTSVYFNIDRTKSVCFRSGPFLNYFKLSAKDVNEGIGFFIHYRLRKLYRIKYQNGIPNVKQRVVDTIILKAVFDQNNLSELMEKVHINAINMIFDLPSQIACQNAGDRYIIGFKQSNKHKYCGLYFKVCVRLIQTDFDVILQQRGYIQKQLTQYFGQKHFQNGNYYIGEFKNGRFHGRGVLIYPKQKKWTYGQYFNGQLKNVMQSSVNPSSAGCQAAIKKIHEYSKPYIQSKIQLFPSQKYLFTQLQFIDQKDPFQHESIDYTKQQNRIHENLNLVQSDYTLGKYQPRTQQALKDLMLLKNKEKSPKKVKKQNIDQKAPSRQKSKSNGKIKYLSPFRNKAPIITQTSQNIRDIRENSKSRSKQKQQQQQRRQNKIISPKNGMGTFNRNFTPKQTQKYISISRQNSQPTIIKHLTHDNQFSYQQKLKLPKSIYQDKKSRQRPIQYTHISPAVDFLTHTQPQSTQYRKVDDRAGYHPYSYNPYYPYEDYYTRKGDRVGMNSKRINSPEKYYERRPFRYLDQQNDLDYETHRRLSNYPYSRRQYPY